ncbi:MAG: hypothetical protein LAO19_06725 [Acidobacteriia bacterium]|nr:hypothetical protein [Terriglobia bacterium]
MSLSRVVSIGAFAAISTVLVTSSANSQQDPLENIRQNMHASNISVLSYNDLNGRGDGGESMAIQKKPDGSRILYIPHRGAQNCLSVVDVTHPEKPVVLNQLPSPAPGNTRCDELALSGNVLVVADQGSGSGPSVVNHILTPEVRAQGKSGMWVLDVSDLDRVKKAKSLQDIAFSFFNTGGPHSVGIHALWFIDGRFAHLASGVPDDDPIYEQDDQMYVVVDLKDPKNPREAGRWWLPGTQKGDACLPGCKPKRLVNSYGGAFRPHEVLVPKDRPDRAYMGYLDGGVVILDISGIEEVRAGRATKFTPKLIAQMKLNPPDIGFTHTAMPLVSRNLMVVNSEGDVCSERGPRPMYLVDIREETNPLIVGTFPYPPNTLELCKRPGAGTHNFAPSGLIENDVSFPLKDTVLASNTKFGLRIYHLQDQHVPYPAKTPPLIEEIGYFLPPPAAKNNGEVNINYSIVDENGLIYVLDGKWGGLYIIKYTGEIPLS